MIRRALVLAALLVACAATAQEKSYAEREAERIKAVEKQEAEFQRKVKAVRASKKLPPRPITMAVRELAAVGPKLVTMIPVGWLDVTQAPFTTDQAQAMAKEGTDFWNTEGLGAIAMTPAGEATHFLPVKFTPGDCNGDWTGAIAAAGQSAFPAYLNNAPDCGYYQGNVGRPGLWTHGGMLPHELGHNLGMQHTGEVKNCPGGIFDPDPLGACSFAGYGYGYDVMGTGSGVNGPHAYMLGIRQTPEISIAVPSSQTVSLPVKFQRPIPGLTFWIESCPLGVCVTYTGWPMFGSLDAVLVAKLAPGESWRDVAAGLTITRAGTTAVSILAVLPPPSPTPTPIVTPGGATPTPTPTASGDPVCRFGFSVVSCTPTPTPEVTWTPTPAASATPTPTSWTPTESPTTPPTDEPTATPIAPTALPTTNPTPPKPPTPTPGGCGGGNSMATLFAASTVLAVRQSRRPKR